MKIFFLLLPALLLAACVDNKQYVVNGNSGAFTDGYKVYLFQRVGEEGISKLNSTVVENNSFTLKGRVETPCDALILLCDSVSFDENTFEFLNEDSRPIVVDVILEPGEICVTSCDKGDECQFVASGARLNDLYNKIQAGVDSVNAVFPNNPDKMFPYVASVVKENVTNIVGVLMFERWHTSMPKDMKLELIDSLALYYGDKYAALQVETREAWQYQQLRKEQAKSVLPGNLYKNVQEKNAVGAVVSLKSAVDNSKNKYLLLEFWATWCVPCMNELPCLMDAYADFNKRGFEIYSVSLNDDESAGEWASVVKGKGIKWINVRASSDSNVKDEYGIYGIPANFLIDCATGKIVASRLRGNALKEKLTELFDNI